MQVSEILKKVEITLEAKGNDYNPNGDPFFAFRFAANLASHFYNKDEKAFAFLVGLKLARLITLQGKDPNNEPVLDTHFDLIGYSVKWMEWKSSIPEECKPTVAPSIKHNSYASQPLNGIAHPHDLR